MPQDCARRRDGSSPRRRRTGRQALVVLLAAACITACSGAKSSTAGGGSGPTSTVAASGAATQSATAPVLNVLAANGIATVAGESSSAPLRPVSGAVRMRFTEAQVTSMAGGLDDHAGILGSTLDAIVPHTGGAPPFSYVLAAWVSGGTSGGAAMVRAVMGAQSWTEAPSLVFPTLALPLFTADVIAAIGGPAASNATAGTSKFESGSARPVAVLTGVVNAPCTLVANFMQGVLDTVFHALSLTAPTGSSVAAQVGSFFVSLWNTAVSLASAVVQGLVKAVGTSVVGKIAALAASAATIAEIASNITPWSVKVTATPGSVVLGGNPGSFKAVTTSPAGVDYPAAVKDCAGALNPPIALPALSAKGAPATWALSGPLIATSATSVTLDPQGANTLAYTTGSGACPGSTSSSAATASGTVIVTRPAVDKLRTLVNTLISGFGSYAGTLAQPILQPLLAAILSQLDQLTQFTGTGTVALTAPTGANARNACPCPVGTWKVTNETVTALRATGGAGAVVTVGPEGLWKIDHSGSAPLVSEVIHGTITYTGYEIDQVNLPKDATSTSGTWDGKGVSGELFVRTDTFGIVHTRKEGTQGLAFTGTWTCQGDAMTSTYPGTGVTLTMSRISH